MKKYFSNLYKDDFNKFTELLRSNLVNNKKMFIITANPEIYMKAKENRELSKILLDKHTTVVADGIGVVRGSKKLDEKVNKITGVDISQVLLRLGNECKSKVFLLGATKKVNDNLVAKIKKEYPNLEIVASFDGYGDSENEIKKVLTLKPDIIMVALGTLKQELLINSVYDKASKGIFIGVGGSFDIISGCKKRAPEVFIKTDTEWLYRLVKEPKRIKRFCKYNIKFLRELKK